MVKGEHDGVVEEVMKMLLSGMAQSDVSRNVGCSRWRVGQIARSRRFKRLRARFDSEIKNDGVNLMGRVEEVFELGLERMREILEDRETDGRLVKDIVIGLGGMCGLGGMRGKKAGGVVVGGDVRDEGEGVVSEGTMALIERVSDVMKCGVIGGDEDEVEVGDFDEVG
ncbi:MAG TPA: hypothetical protein VLH56_08455 [Dissulfurispiraceae bacterium]|nr:hypothetical protein [Dissulfurispiraceae bacterium]